MIDIDVIGQLLPNPDVYKRQKEGIRIKNWYETTIDPSTKRNLWGREIYPRCMLNTLREIRERYGDSDTVSYTHLRHV